MESATARMTQAQYARHRGVSRPAVLKAVRSSAAGALKLIEGK